MKVLSIVGPGRSGSTILATVLGEAPGVLSVGELRWLWRRGLLEQRMCGCGQPPVSCPLWSVVLARVLGVLPGRGTSDPLVRDVEAIVSAQEEISARTNRLKVIRSATRPDQAWPALRRMQSVTRDVCSALVEATGARLIVDTSKRAQEAAVLASMEHVDHYVMHIVRDPRAVAYSWRRVKPVSRGGGGATMGTRRLLPAVWRWVENGVGAELLRREIPPARWLFLRYEDFASQPRETVARIFTFLDLDVPDPFQSADTVVLGPNHIVAGNPSRFRRGAVTIVADTEWRRGMSRRDQLGVAALTTPLLQRYQYPTRPDRPEASTAAAGRG